MGLFIIIIIIIIIIPIFLGTAGSSSRTENLPKFHLCIELNVFHPEVLSKVVLGYYM